LNTTSVTESGREVIIIFTYLYFLEII
jgi:hypothetical protein